jgi:hypothetical protein
VDVEQLAILGIVVFSFMAVVNMFSAIRTYKRTKRWQPTRVRRLIGGRESARSVALSVVSEVAHRFEKDVLASRESGQLTERLEEAIAEARAYFLGRVETIHKPLFTEAVEEIILKGSQAEDGVTKKASIDPEST